MEKVVAWGCWSNDQYIAEPGQCGVLHGRLFQSEDAARRFYASPLNSVKGDAIVKVTCEIAEKS